jgi:hypothetical protein
MPRVRLDGDVDVCAGIDYRVDGEWDAGTHGDEDWRIVDFVGAYASGIYTFARLFCGVSENVCVVQ